MAVSLTRKVVLDTNVFIDYLRDDLHEEWVLGRARGFVRFMSSIVLMELEVGANTPKRRRAVRRIAIAFPASRLISPNPALFQRAGALFVSIHGDRFHGDRLGPMDDLLIALTAWHLGASVVTSNRSDFERIAKHLSGLSVIPPAAIHD